MKKRINFVISIILSLIIFSSYITFPNTIFAQENVQETDTKIFINDVRLQTKAYMMNDRILVPLRKITETLGSSVEWDGDTQMITVKRGLQTAIFRINDNNVYSREKQVLDTHSVLYEDTTLIPLRAIAEIFGATVLWDGDSNSVYINCDIPDTKETVDDFMNYGFRRFNYYSETFMDNHADGSGFNSAVWGTALSSLSEWSGRGLKAMVNFFNGEGFDTEYEKDMYKKVISQVLSELNGDYAADQFPETFKTMIKGAKEASSFSIDEAYTALEKAGRQEGLSSAEISSRKKDLDIFSDTLSKVGKTIKWSQFTMDEIAFIMGDYTENIHMLTVLQDALSDDKNNETLKEAVFELKTEYANTYLKTLVDIKDEIIEYGAGAIIGSASSLYSIVSFSIEFGASITGWKDYSDNVMDAATLTTVVSALNWELDEMANDIYDVRTKTIKSNVKEKQWADYVDLFNLTKAAVKEQYICMYNVTSNEMEKKYLQDQMDTLDGITISNELPNGYYEAVSIKENDLAPELSEKEGIRYKAGTWAETNDSITVIYYFDRKQDLFEQPYFLYNGEGVDLKVEWMGFYGQDDDLVHLFRGNPKMRIVYGDDGNGILETDERITNGQEIDFSDYGLSKDVKIWGWALIFDGFDILSKDEFESKYGKNFKMKAVENTIAYNYIYR